MSKFYTRKSDGKKLVEYGKISNGQILTEFNEKTGTPISNDYLQVFVTKEELKSDFEPFNFKIDSSEKNDRIIVKALSDILYQFRNYGIAENQAQCFEEFYQSASFKSNVYRDMVKLEKDAEFKDFLANDDDEFEFGDAEDLFNMMAGGIIPILKKMLIEAQKE